MKLHDYANITKNLVSVSKLARDNSFYFEFHPSNCHVKSQATHEVLLQDVLGKDGLDWSPKFNLQQLSEVPSSSFLVNDFSSMHQRHKTIHPRIPLNIVHASSHSHTNAPCMRYLQTMAQ